MNQVGLMLPWAGLEVFLVFSESRVLSNALDA